MQKQMNKQSFLISSVVMIIVSAMLFLFQQHALPLLEFNRTAITSGEHWRLLTGNLMHTNHWHLVFNLAGLMMLTHLFHRLITNTHFIMFSVINAIGVSVLIYYFSTTIEYYVGLSGYLHGLFVYGCLIEIYRGRQGSWMLLAGITIKIGYENIYGATESMRELINANVATDAHLYGALIAVVQFGMFVVHVKSKLSKGHV